MIINRSTQFDRALKKLERQLKNQVLEKLEVFLENWQDPRLKTHKLKGEEDTWAFRVTYSMRVIFTFDGSNIILLLDVGMHDDVY
jgi:addiction module RelE/StbE family toxin